MRRIARNQRQRQPRPFTTRQLANLCRRLGPGKAEPPQLRTHRAGARALHLLRHMLQRGIVAVQFLDLILREIAHAHLARRAHLPFHRRQLRREQSCQRRLAIAVAPQQRDPVIGVNIGLPSV